MPNLPRPRALPIVKCSRDQGTVGRTTEVEIEEVEIEEEKEEEEIEEEEEEEVEEIEEEEEGTE